MSSKMIESRFIRLKTYKFMAQGGIIDHVGDYCFTNFTSVNQRGNHKPFTKDEQEQLERLIESGVNPKKATRQIRSHYQVTWGWNGTHQYK